MLQHEKQAQNEQAPCRFQIEKLEERVAPANVAVLFGQNVQGVVVVGGPNASVTASATVSATASPFTFTFGPIKFWSS